MTQEFAPDITLSEMFRRAVRRPLGGADSNVERFVLAVASVWLAPGDFTVDLGANHGQHARVLASRVGPGGHALLVEADPTLAADLDRGARDSTVPISVVNQAVGDADMPSLTFYRHPTLDQEGSLFRRADVGGYEEIQVDGSSLDALLADLPAPRFVKIDVEGAEFSVLRGAAKLLALASPLIACELSYDVEVASPGGVNYTMRDMGELLSSAGWSLYALDGSRIPPDELNDSGFGYHYQVWIARDGSPAAMFLDATVPVMASAFAWGATTTPPYPFHLDKHPVR